jgi:hypothetical protein
MNGPLPLPPVLSSKLSDYRRRVWLVKLAEGLLAAVFGLAVSYLLVLGLDRLIDTPAWLRWILLIAGTAVPGLGLPLKWHRWVWRQRRLEDAARLLRWKFPRLGDQLLGIVELAKDDSAVTGRSERLVHAAMAQADEAVKDQDFSDAVPKARHRHWGLAAAGATVLVMTGFLAINDAARNAMLRWMMPWRNIERFTFARVETLPNPLVVPLAEPFTLPVSLSAETRWRPDDASGSIAGQPDIEVERSGESYALAFPPQKNDAEILVKVGDVRETIRLEPRPRPELSALHVRLKLPDYLQYKTIPVMEIRGGAVSVIKGAQATFEATASRTLTRAEIDGRPAKTDGNRLLSEPQAIEAARDVVFTWRDSLGLTARVPLVLKVQPAEDEAPKLVARRESIEQVVLDSEVVVFDVSASDDFGIRQMGLEWQGLDDGTDASVAKTKGSKVAAAGAPETKQLESRATFCASREAVEPQSLEIRAWAEDYVPGRERSHSASFVLHVLNKTDHALWVTQQMGKWLEAAKETYEREQQLHQTNKELRAMSASDLDRPENRRRVAQQSAAENANAERLSSLNQAGRHLVEQATKNPEFDAPRLESWATMLKMLQDIAQNRMPSVADLLKKSADAKADAKLAQGPQGGQNQPSNPDAKPGEPQTSPGEPKPGQPQSAQNSQSSQPQDPNGKQGVPQDAKSAPQIAVGPQTPKGGAQDQPDPNAKPKEPVPSIKLTESTMFKPEAADEKPGAPKPPGAGKLGLPTNSLAAGPKKDGEACPPAESSAQQALDEGVQEQKDLLAQFAKVSDQLSEILASLEASTFVKRFKAASREQTQLASGITQQTLDAFGIVRDQPGRSLQDLEEDDAVQSKLGGFVARLFGAGEAPDKPGDHAEPLLPPPDLPAGAEKKADPPKPEAPFVTTYAPLARGKAKDQSEIVKIIQSDLEAYYQRKPVTFFKKVLGEMKQTRVVQELKRVGDRAADNLTGNAIHGAEFWADTLDRWAEEMVKAASGFT